MKRVVLVRTAGPRNAGAVLRAVANFGPAELWLVAPDRPSLLVHPEFEQMAHGVEHVRARRSASSSASRTPWPTATRSVGLHRARARVSACAATGARARDEVARAPTPPASRVALVFGSEETGLTVEEAAQVGELCYLATSSEHTSINLAMAVGHRALVALLAARTSTAARTARA